MLPVYDMLYFLYNWERTDRMELYDTYCFNVCLLESTPFHFTLPSLKGLWCVMKLLIWCSDL